MKRLIILIAALLLSSNALAQHRHFFAQPVLYPTVALCELADNADQYKGKTVRIVGLAYISPVNMFVLRSDGMIRGQCEGRDSMATVWVKRSPDASNPVAEFLKKLNKHAAEHNRVSAKVEIVGKVIDGDKNNSSCFGPRFWIEANSIRQSSPTMPLFLE